MSADVLATSQVVAHAAGDTMHVSRWVWAATLGGLGVLLALDLAIVDRKPQ